MPLTNAEVDAAVPAAGTPNRALTNAALKEVIVDIAAVQAAADAALAAHEAAADPHPGYLTAAEGNAAYQPASANLTEYAGVNPTAAGLALLDDTDAAAQRATLGLVIGTDVDAFAATVSQAEAEAGSATTVRNWTAQRVAQAIAALAPAGSPAWGDITGTLSAQTDLQAALDAKVDALAPVVISASTNLTRASHGNRLLICNSGSAINLTIEDDTTGVWEDGDFFPVLNIGAGTVTIQGDGTSVVTAGAGYALTIPQNGSGAAQRSGTNAWNAYGQLAVQAQATWEAGAGTTESIISPAKLAAAIAALAPAGGGVLYLGARTWGMLAQINGSAHVVIAVGTITVMGTGGTAATPWNTDRGWVRVAYTNTGAAANLTAGIRSANGSVDMAPGADARATPATFVGYIGTADALTGCRGFLGWRTATNDPTSTEPSAFTNFAGIGYDSDMSEYVFMHNDAAGVATEVVLNGGSGFPCNSNGTDKIKLEMAFTGEGGAQTLHWRVTNEDSNVSVSGTATTNLPASGSLMNAYAIRNSGANTTAPVVHIGDLGGGKLALTDVSA